MRTWSPPSLRRTLARVQRITDPADEVPRIANPFARFRTRSRWLTDMMRQGRNANPARSDRSDGVLR